MQTKVKCIHHWEIEEPNGPISEGICKNCGEKKEFQNSIFTDTFHITLEREQGDDPTEQKKRWNRWLRD